MTIAMPRIQRVPAAERGITIADFLVPIRLSERLGVRVRHLTLVAAGALLIALAANLYVVLPGNPVPITGQTFSVLLVGGALGFRRGIAATGLYVILGFWFPVYAERSQGLETILGLGEGGIVLGPTGGYIIGFVLAGALVGRLAELGWDRRIGGSVGAMLLGNAVIYLVGLPWLMLATGQNASWTIENGLAPFLLGDALKLALAAAAFPFAWWIVGRRPDER